MVFIVYMNFKNIIYLIENSEKKRQYAYYKQIADTVIFKTISTNDEY